MAREDRRAERKEHKEHVEMLTLRGTVQGVKYFYAQTAGDGDVEIGGKGHIHEESCEFPRDCNHRRHLLATITWIPLAFSGIKAPYNGRLVEAMAYPPKKDGRLPTVNEVKEVAIVRAEDDRENFRGRGSRVIPEHER